MLPEDNRTVPEESWSLDWDGITPVATPLGDIRDRLEPLAGGQPTLMLATRAGGERLRVDAQRRPLKKLFQEHDIPPWQRDRVVVVWHDEIPVGVLGPLRLAADGWTLKDALDPKRSGRLDDK